MTDKLWALDEALLVDARNFGREAALDRMEDLLAITRGRRSLADKLGWLGRAIRR